MVHRGLLRGVHRRLDAGARGSVHPAEDRDLMIHRQKADDPRRALGVESLQHVRRRGGVRGAEHLRRATIIEGLGEVPPREVATEVHGAELLQRFEQAADPGMQRRVDLGEVG